MPHSSDHPNLERRMQGERRDPSGRRRLADRRVGERRLAIIMVPHHRRVGGERRSGRERRNGLDRRTPFPRRSMSAALG